ncbi:dTDP-4-dehydrorhamnose 3,5-epimerase family protein [Mycobacterium sp. NAZ190054]|uniref:dTDP-4-dehydrorhamnose 3,5-epimerase family protein n=1 Tax=Mycobacterium sp. NAZ190054 TaxID=1747766 RepID=UPI00079B5939|nr:dTDP-4-dehydrorhamnose 3,5-epimerase family protein [Mycobacterium sp. NAZ190054]KWX56949.1 dTDP-4-dehydrorhamnose 3,5-epimerase [Mycobacterium sp. NAZ190054]
MNARELTVPGAWEITPVVHTDTRGAFFEWFTDAGFTTVTGHRLDLRQANCSVSRAGVLRGVHFAQLPPSQAKYITCMRGAVVDVVVDIRVGSPTFGRWDAVVLDDRTHRSVYLSEGLGHAFLALRDDSTVTYLCSAGYDPVREHTIDPLDPALGIDWGSWRPESGAGELILSDRDRAAPSLEQAQASGLLPTWQETQAFVEELRRNRSR